MKKITSLILSTVIVILSIFSTTAFAQEQTKLDNWSQKHSFAEFEINYYSESSDGIIDSHAYLKNDKFSMTLNLPITEGDSSEVNCICDGDYCYLIFTSFPFFYIKSEEVEFSIEDIINMIEIAETTFIKSYEVTESQTTYYVEEYSYYIESEGHSENGTSKFYFIGDELIKSEYTYIDENGYSVYTRIEYISFEVDDSVFEVPWYSIDILPILKFFFNLFNIEIII